MNIVMILVASLVALIVVRIMCISLYCVFIKILKISTVGEKFNLSCSIAFYLIYIELFSVSASVVATNNELSNIEWFFVYTFIGIASMLWCYFSWEMSFRAKPILGLNDKQVIIKKIFVFAGVMILSFVNGYDTMYKEFYGENVFPEIRVLNATMIVGVIAFDRLLNQIVNYKKIKENE